MIKIDKLDLEKLERIGHGDFGVVYKKDDKTAYKIYNKMISNYYSGIEYNNPIFILPKSHFTRIMAKCKKLNYTDGINDLIYINGEFKGVSIPYYDGDTLNNLLNKPLKLKIELSKQLVRNSKELIKNHLYTTDHKLNNIMLSNNEIKIIDLDDIKTHPSIIRNPILERKSIISLGSTIQRFLNISGHFPINYEIAQKLKREKREYLTNYNKIEKYIENLQKEKNIIFIDNETDIEKLKELINHFGFETVYVVEDNLDKNSYLEIIEKLKAENIELFDFVKKDKIDNYPESEIVNESYLLSKKELIKIKEKN